jgi:hypothetical protein
MGTPLPLDDYRKPDGTAYLSGTEWEYLNALEGNQLRGRPKMFVYRRTEQCLLDPRDPQFKDKLRQYENVEAFFAGFRNPDGSISGGYNEYATPDDFRQQLDFDLRSVIHLLLKEQKPAEETKPQRPTPPIPPLWLGSPFPGLRAFTPDDAPIFFGRDRESDGSS